MALIERRGEFTWRCQSYLSPLLRRQQFLATKKRLVDKIRAAHLDYDTIVGAAVSGAMIAPALAATLRKHMAVVRRPGCSHSHHEVEGIINPRRYIFVDDIVDSGATLRRVEKALEKSAAESYQGAPAPRLVAIVLYYSGLCEDSEYTSVLHGNDVPIYRI